jgi:hypothetical protein
MDKGVVSEIPGRYGKPDKYQGVYDITKKKETEEALKQPDSR